MPPKLVADPKSKNELHYGDNLEILRGKHFPAESVDLVYLDPPFNSNRSYNVLFKTKSGEESQAQIEAFDDTWTWSQESETLYEDLRYSATGKLADAIVAMRQLIGDNDVLAYLVMMAARLVELHRVLRPTGSLYLHCDPTASHYLKVLLDAIFGLENFRSEIIWKRTNARGTTGNWPRLHDVILAYAKTSSAKFNAIKVLADKQKMPHTLITGPGGLKYQTYELTGPGTTKDGDSGKPWRGHDPAKMGRHWGNDHEQLDEWDRQGLIHWPANDGFPRRRDENPFNPDDRKVVVGDVWADIDRLNQTAKERLGYPTQKPVSLLERIISASTDEGDVVLDPFCGCGTTIDAAHNMHRNWVGIDVTYLAIDLIKKRLRAIYGDAVSNTYTVHGVPKDIGGALALCDANKFDFERWAVSLVDGTPNQKQVGDKGIDGVIRFPLDDKSNVGRVMVQVKGGAQVGPTAVRDLIGVVETQRAQMGLLITMSKPTKAMLDAARSSGTYVHETTHRRCQRVQVVSVEDLLNGKKPDIPTAILPYVKARPHRGKQLELDAV